MTKLGKKIQATFPKFPPEIIETWLEPPARNRAWPPEEDVAAWLDAFKGWSLESWKSADWVKDEINVANLNLTVAMEGTLKKLQGFIDDPVNHPEDAAAFDKHLAYLIKHGSFEHPIALASIDVFGTTQYTIVDGNHRMLAYRCWKNIFQTEALDEETNREKFMEAHPKFRDMQTPKDKQPFWIVTFP